MRTPGGTVSLPLRTGDRETDRTSERVEDSTAALSKKVSGRSCLGTACHPNIDRGVKLTTDEAVAAEAVADFPPSPAGMEKRGVQAEDQDALVARWIPCEMYRGHPDCRPRHDDYVPARGFGPVTATPSLDGMEKRDVQAKDQDALMARKSPSCKMLKDPNCGHRHGQWVPPREFVTNTATPSLDEVGEIIKRDVPPQQKEDLHPDRLVEQSLKTVLALNWEEPRLPVPDAMRLTSRDVQGTTAYLQTGPDWVWALTLFMVLVVILAGLGISKATVLLKNRRVVGEQDREMTAMV